MKAKQPSTRRTEPLVEVRGLTVCYIQRRPLTGETFRVQALDHVDLTIPWGSSIALVGRSGSGKSTLARCLMRLEAPSAGEIRFDGEDLFAMSRDNLFSARRKIQLIMQDPAAAFNPRFSAVEIVEEPLRIHRWGSKRDRCERALHLMEQVGLLREWGEKRPLELSGGQRQRLAIARALALQPIFLILDEALSGSDLSIQAQIVNLLLELQARYSLTYLLITHDLALAGHFADEIAVMHQGKIVERAKTSDLFTNPQHPESRALLAPMHLGQTELEPLSH